MTDQPDAVIARAWHDNPAAGVATEQTMGEASRPVVSGAISGAAAGALLGSVVPGLGTLFGAAIGGILGAKVARPRSRQ